MKRNLLLLLSLVLLSAVKAQRVSHRFQDMTMSEALRQLNKMTRHYTINFIYNDLEDFRVYANVRQQSISDAVRQLMGFYPMSMTMPADSIISVECVQKLAFRCKGRILDERGRPLAYANVALLAPVDSACINGGVSNEGGDFIRRCELCVSRPLFVLRLRARQVRF